MPRIKTGLEKVQEIGTALWDEGFDFEEMDGGEWLRGWVGDLYWAVSGEHILVDSVRPEHVVAIIEALCGEEDCECTSTRQARKR